MSYQSIIVLYFRILSILLHKQDFLKVNIHECLYSILVSNLNYKNYAALTCTHETRLDVDLEWRLGCFSMLQALFLLERSSSSAALMTGRERKRRDLPLDVPEESEEVTVLLATSSATALKVGGWHSMLV